MKPISEEEVQEIIDSIKLAPPDNMHITIKLWESTTPNTHRLHVNIVCVEQLIPIVTGVTTYIPNQIHPSLIRVNIAAAVRQVMRELSNRWIAFPEELND